MTRIHVLSTPLRHPLAQYYYFYNSPHIILCVVSVFNLIEGDETARGGGWCGGGLLGVEPCVWWACWPVTVSLISALTDPAKFC